MATMEEARQAIIDGIASQAKDAYPLHLLHMAEALAWLGNPNQPHGGSAQAQS